MARMQTTGERHELEVVLAPFLRIPGTKRYQQAHWLKSTFDAFIWYIELNGIKLIDWRIPLYDGSLLTSHPKLWETLRSWLIARTHVDFTGGRISSPSTQWTQLKHVLFFIDCFLLESERFQLITHALESISFNELCASLAIATRHRKTVEAIYQWPERLSKYLRAQIACMPQETFDRAQKICPNLDKFIPEPELRVTSLDEKEIILARAWIISDGFRPKDEDCGIRLSRMISRHIYRSTLIGRDQRFSLPTELLVVPTYKMEPEYERVGAFDFEDRRADKQTLANYVSALTPLTLLSAEGLPAPIFSAESLRNYSLSIDGKEKGRYRTLPQAIVFKAFREACEYVVEYGDALVDSYLNLVEVARENDVSLFELSRTRGVDACLHEKCKELGIRLWTVHEELNGTTLRGQPIKQETRYSLIRRNAGLYESLKILYGAIELIIGLLSARRVAELGNLIAKSCLDDSESRLVFRNCKSGVLGLREKEARPIPSLAVRCIKQLERLQDGLLNLEVIFHHQNLFSAPKHFGKAGLIKFNFNAYQKQLDFFCDWIETPLDDDGRRYYFTQHQLRRFFAMLFFWGGGFGGVDTLRWFLAHTNAEHLWRYITESIPGKVVRSVAAEWVAYGVKHVTKEAALLSSELVEHFGTSEFSVLDDEALSLHIEDLIEEGRLSVEPQFLDNGTQYRIAVVLRNAGTS
jgi:tetrahydromethanopterin S-methyltransferase subunit F